MFHSRGFLNFSLLTRERLKLHEATTIPAVDNSVLGHCRLSLSVGTDFSDTIPCIVYFKKRTQSHLKLKNNKRKKCKVTTLCEVLSVHLLTNNSIKN